MLEERRKKDRVNDKKLMGTFNYNLFPSKVDNRFRLSLIVVKEDKVVDCHTFDRVDTFNRFKTNDR